MSQPEEQLAQIIPFPSEWRQGGDGSGSSALIERLHEDLADLDRLTFNAGLNPIFKKTINRIALTFRLRVAYLLSPVREGQRGPLREECLPLEALEELDYEQLEALAAEYGLERLAQIRQDIRQLIDEVISDSRYRQAVACWQNNPENGPGRAHLDNFLSHHGFLEVNLPAETDLYHSVSIRNPEDNPRAAVEKIRDIFRQGLLAIPAPENLPGLSSVFCANSADQLSGDVLLRFRAPGEKLWTRDGQQHDLLQIFRPVLHTGFELLYRTAENPLAGNAALPEGAAPVGFQRALRSAGVPYRQIGTERS